jgi:endonuclease/exonuclease/phosphatase (EEP) superfamily protein YafD
MAQENTTAWNSSAGALETTVPAKATNDTVTADTYRQMLDVLEQLASHNHIFYDDYNTVCECQCQCACSRGTV